MTSFNEIRSHRQFVLAVSALAVFVDGFFSSLVIPLLPVYTKKYNMSQTEIGILFASFSLFNLFGSPVIGPLSDRIGRRKPMMVGFVLLILSTVMYAYANSFYFLLVARSLQGLASAATWTAGSALIGDVFPPDEQGVPYSRLATAVGFGGMIGPTIGGFLVDLTKGDMKLPFLFSTLLVLINIIMRAVMIDPPQAERSGNEGTGYSVLLKDSRVIMIACASGITQMISVSLDTTLATFLDQRFGMSSTAIGIIYGVLAFSYAIGSLVCGKLSDKYANRRYEFIAVGMAVTQIFLSFTYRIPYLYIQLAIICGLGPVFALAISPQQPALNEIVERKYGGVYIGSAGAVMNVVWSIGAIAGPIGVNAAIDRMGYYKSLTYICTGLSLFTILFVALTIIRKERGVVVEDPERQKLIQQDEKKAFEARRKHSNATPYGSAEAPPRFQNESSIQ